MISISLLNKETDKQSYFAKLNAISNTEGNHTNHTVSLYQPYKEGNRNSKILPKMHAFIMPGYNC